MRYKEPTLYEVILTWIVPFLVLAGAFSLFFLCRSGNCLEDGPIFWKYTCMRLQGGDVPAMDAIFPGHPMWQNLYALLFRLFPSLGIELIGTLISAFFGAFCVLLTYGVFRVIGRNIADAVLGCAIYAFSFIVFFYSTMLNNGIFASFAINLVLWVCVVYAARGFPFYSSAALGAVFSVACAFYISPLPLIPVIVIVVIAGRWRAGKIVSYLAVLALSAVLTAMVVYRMIYGAYGYGEGLFDCVYQYYMYAVWQAVTHISFFERLRAVFSNLGYVYFGAGYAGVCAGVGVAAALYLFLRKFIFGRLYRDLKWLVVSLSLYIPLIYVFSGGFVRSQKILLGFVGPMTCVIYAILSDAGEAVRAKTGAHARAVIIILLAGLIFTDAHYRMNPSARAAATGCGDPGGVVGEEFYRYINQNTSKKSLMLYDANYIGASFGNFIMFHTGRRSLTFEDNRVLFLGGRMPLGLFLNDRVYDQYWLVSTRTQYGTILIPADGRFEKFAIFRKEGNAGGVGFYKYGGLAARGQFGLTEITDEDAAQVRRRPDLVTAKGLIWRPFSFEGRDALVLIPRFTDKVDDIREKYLFYW